jgi:hypothetical protein
MISLLRSCGNTAWPPSTPGQLLPTAARRPPCLPASSKPPAAKPSAAWQDTGLVLTTRSGRPIEPRNLVRSFRRICDHNNLRAIKLHHQYTTASVLKKLHVPPRGRSHDCRACPHLDHDADLDSPRRGSPQRRSRRFDMLLSACRQPITVVRVTHNCGQKVVNGHLQDLREGVLPGGAKGT